ncbi:MAG TPA: pre-16S rRNA-processing nuclease YqgF [Bacillota bacterium]
MKNDGLRQAVLAIDPGTEKFGYAILREDGTVLRKGIEKTGQLLAQVLLLLDEFEIRTVILGDRTGSKDFDERLFTELEKRSVSLVKVNEDNSSWEGRFRYLQDHRHGWRRFVPLGLQTPPEAYDDYVAVILGERYLRDAGQAG